MVDADRVREVMQEAVVDVTPSRLRELIHTRLAEAAITPGVFVIESAKAGTDTEIQEREAVIRRAAGVQLIYEGLSLTRTLARNPPWQDGTAAVDTNMAVLMADVLVARGFYLLARTEAAMTAVETVRSFGYDETVAESEPETDAPSAALEIDIFELAIVAGVTAVDANPPAETRAFVSDMARDFRANGSEPPSDTTIEDLGAFIEGADTVEVAAEEG